MITDAIHLDKQASAPPVKEGRAALYVKDDGALYYVTSAGTEVALSGAFGEAWPIGSVFTAIVAANPNTLVGYGTWVRFGSGRMLVSQDGTDAAFDTAEETGGGKTITQSVAQMPVHTHVQNSHTHTQAAHRHGFTLGNGAGTQFADDSGGTVSTQLTDFQTPLIDAATAVNQNAGNGDPMDIMNPYIVVYMWKRTA